MAGEALMSISNDERERAIFRNRRIALADLESNLITAESRGRAEGRAEGIAEGRAEGRAEGIAEGRAEGRAEGIAKGRAEYMISVAHKAFKMKIPINEIIELTGLTYDELEKIRGID